MNKTEKPKETEKDTKEIKDTQGSKLAVFEEEDYFEEFDEEGMIII
jgi:hypothetical protein